MNKLYPIRFKAEPRERVWGGNYLVKTLKKEFEEDPDKGGLERIEEKKIGESWEIWSLYGSGSVAKNGFLADNPIDDIIETYMGDFMGEELFQYYHGNFPLMVKILDIRDRLSVQLHPDDKTAFEREDSYGKAEFWYIMEADPDSEIYMGFNREITPQELYDRAKNGRLQEVLNIIKPKKGDCFYIEPGCVHSAGKGVVIAEITESSDITYRIYDWGRENDPKTARKMHLNEAIDIINYSKYDPSRFLKQEVKESMLVADTEYFMIKTIKLEREISIFPLLTNSFIIYLCTQGAADFKMHNGEIYSIKAGESIVVPAGMEDFLLIPQQKEAFLIEAYMPPVPEEEDGYINECIHEDYHHHKEGDCNCSDSHNGNNSHTHCNCGDDCDCHEEHDCGDDCDCREEGKSKRHHS